jgi:hypothetical protein
MSPPLNPILAAAASSTRATLQAKELMRRGLLFISPSSNSHLVISSSSNQRVKGAPSAAA